MPLPNEMDMLQTELIKMQVSLKLMYDNTTKDIEGDTDKQRMLRELYAAISICIDNIDVLEKETN